ncbi:unnamed protein product [Rotaria sp. Silwood2]|nr:unnamed protein product [Rotaria sp. Silwood2]CAF4561164.1 unnamed protein product [Rotaria sp. Silwood2]
MIQNALLKERRETFRSNETNSDSLSSSSLTSVQSITKTSANVFEWKISVMNSPKVPELIILPVYSTLPNEMQTKIFDPASSDSRKVCCFYYVVDPEFVEQKVYNPKSGIDSRVVTPISQGKVEQAEGSHLTLLAVYNT